MRLNRLPAVLVPLLALACQAQPASVGGAGASPAPVTGRATDVARRTAKQDDALVSKIRTGQPLNDPAKRLAGLTAALSDALATRELARAQSITRIISNNGGALISDKSGGLVSKIRTGAGLISDGGGGLVSNNGGNVVGQNGAGYALAQAAATPELFKEILHEDAPFQYVTAFYKPDFQGEVLGFDLADYRARGRSAAVVERYVWDAVPYTMLDTPSKGLFDIRATFPVRVETSRRTVFTRKIDLVIDMAIKAFEPVLLTAFSSMTADFEMAVPDAAGAGETLVVHAHDFVYPPGAGPGETPDGLYPTPTGFVAEGENARGKLAVKVSTPPAGGVTAALASTFTRPDGAAVTTALTSYADGRREERVGDAASGLEASLRFAADGAGDGEIRDLAADGAVVGRLRWDAAGAGTIALDGTAEAALTLR